LARVDLGGCPSITWRSVAEDALGRVDAQLHKLLGVQHGHLHHLLHPLNLLLAAANVVVRHVGLLLDSHHRHGGVDLRRERDLYLVLVPVDPAQSSNASAATHRLQHQLLALLIHGLRRVLCI
jgi:hypothetical protein